MAFVRCHGHAGRGPEPFGFGGFPHHPQEIEVISDWHMASVSDIGLIRTDTTLDQSQKAEKVCSLLATQQMTGTYNKYKTRYCGVVFVYVFQEHFQIQSLLTHRLPPALGLLEEEDYGRLGSVKE